MNINIELNGHSVGVIKDAMSDMWYLHGQWIGNDSPESISFHQTALQTDAQAVMEGKGGLVVVKYYEEGNDTPGYAVLLGVIDDSLSIRRSLSAESEAWAKETYRLNQLKNN